MQAAGPRHPTVPLRCLFMSVHISFLCFFFLVAVFWLWFLANLYNFQQTFPEPQLWSPQTLRGPLETVVPTGHDFSALSRSNVVGVLATFSLLCVPMFCLYVYVYHTHIWCARRWKTPPDPPKAWLQLPVSHRMDANTGTEPGSAARTMHAFKCWASSRHKRL